MGIPPFLTDAELEQERTPVELFAWVDAKCKELGGTPEAREFARSGDRLAKKFYDEVRPLALVARREFGDRPGVTVKPNLGNDNFDGTISFRDRPQIFIEITYAKNGYYDSLRMEFLAQGGHGNHLARPSVVGTRHSPNRRVDIPNEAVCRDVTLNEHLRYVEDCLKAKADAFYGPQHVLVVVVNDYSPFRDRRDVDILDKLVTRRLCRLSLDFGRLVILGERGELFISKLLDRPRMRRPMISRKI